MIDGRVISDAKGNDKPAISDFRMYMCVCSAGMKKTVLTPLYALGEAKIEKRLKGPSENGQLSKCGSGQRTSLKIWLYCVPNDLKRGTIQNENFDC